MTTYIAILRGINVGGKRKILMADLKAICEKLGYQNVQTYIQSGNVIFSSKKAIDVAKTETILEEIILKNYGFEVPFIILNKSEIEDAISKNPFQRNDIERLHLTFLKAIPENEKLEAIKKFDFSPDKFEIIGKNIFVFCSAGYSDSKLTNQFFETKLKTTTTTRNWKTVLKLQELLIDSQVFN